MKFSPPKDPFGVLAFLHWNHEWNKWHFNESALIAAAEQLAELGVGFVRVDILWSDVYRPDLKYNYQRYDRIVELLTSRGLKILGVLQYNKKDIGPKGAEIWNQPPESFEEFARYVSLTVTHYKTHIKHWEIWNEPNLPVYWAGPQDGLSLYSNLLRLSYKAAKLADSSCVVLNGGITEPIVQDVKNLYLRGAKDYTDIINIHTFIDPHDRDASGRFSAILDGVEDVMEKNGDSQKRIWITEMGCPGVPADKLHLRWFGGAAVGEQEQADWLEKQYEMIQKHPRVEKLFWAFYRDTDEEFKDATDYFGLVRLDLTPKPAFERMKRLIQKSRQDAVSSR